MGTNTYLLGKFLLVWALGVLVAWGQGRKLQFDALFLQDNGMHSVYWTVLVASREELFTLHSTGYNVADERVFLWKICCEIHLFPLKLFTNAKSGKSKVGPDCLSFYEVEKSICIENMSQLSKTYLEDRHRSFRGATFDRTSGFRRLCSSGPDSAGYGRTVLPSTTSFGGRTG